ncbi:hypothetical protein BLOT_007162 [Blomia tropicalis]|nr:hypothetical protein BLOT_007162 [Blomia tropicalis]
MPQNRIFYEERSERKIQYNSTDQNETESYVASAPTTPTNVPQHSPIGISVAGQIFLLILLIAIVSAFFGFLRCHLIPQLNKQSIAPQQRLTVRRKRAPSQLKNQISKRSLTNIKLKEADT